MKRAFAFGFGVLAAGILLDRARIARNAQKGTKKMVPDFVGNYDLDGVSYDPQAKKVVVGSDARTKEPCATSGLSQVDCAKNLAEKSA